MSCSQLETNEKKVLFLLLIVMFLIGYDFPISKNGIVGTYVNNNFNETPFYAEIPYIKDTLILNANNTFKSNYYGNGTYKLNSGIFRNELSISYNYSMGKAGARFILKNKIFSFKKIMLVSDLDYYYEKIK